MLQGPLPFGELMYDLWEAISRDMISKSLDISRLGAMDIGCCNHSYMTSIARWHYKVHIT